MPRLRGLKDITRPKIHVGIISWSGLAPLEGTESHSLHPVPLLEFQVGAALPRLRGLKDEPTATLPCRLTSWSGLAPLEGTESSGQGLHIFVLGVLERPCPA